MEANEEAGVEVMETTVLPLILLAVAEEECKKFQKISAQLPYWISPMDKNKNKTKIISRNFISK